MAARTSEEYVPGTTVYTPDGKGEKPGGQTGGGYLTYEVLVYRPGFRPKRELRCLRKNAHAA